MLVRKPLQILHKINKVVVKKVVNKKNLKQVEHLKVKVEMIIEIVSHPMTQLLQKKMNLKNQKILVK